MTFTIYVKPKWVEEVMHWLNTGLVADADESSLPWEVKWLSDRITLETQFSGKWIVMQVSEHDWIRISDVIQNQQK